VFRVGIGVRDDEVQYGATALHRRENCCFHLMFLAEFVQKHLGERSCSRREESDVEILLGMGINSGVQPVALIVDLDRGFIDRNVIPGSFRQWAVGRLPGPSCGRSIDCG